MAAIELIQAINIKQPELKVMDVYVLPLKAKEQKITSIKIAFATQMMVNQVMEKGLQVMDHQIQISSINRAKILGTPQCTRCYSFEHFQENYKNNQKCCHCSGNHIYKNCTNRSKSPTCANCSGGHKPISNRCPTRKKFLVVPKINSDPEIKIVKKPRILF